MTTHAAAPAPGDKRMQRHHVVTGGWMAATTVWGIGRIVVVAAALRRYGVDPRVFALLELVTSPIYGYTTARLAQLLRSRDHHGAVRWGVLAVVSYLMPDVYVLGSARRMPGRVVSLVLLAALLLALASVVMFVRSVRADRACPEGFDSDAQPHEAVREPPGPVGHRVEVEMDPGRRHRG